MVLFIQHHFCFASVFAGLYSAAFGFVREWKLKGANDLDLSNSEFRHWGKVHELFIISKGQYTKHSARSFLVFTDYWQMNLAAGGFTSHQWTVKLKCFPLLVSVCSQRLFVKEDGSLCNTAVQLCFYSFRKSNRVICPGWYDNESWCPVSCQICNLEGFMRKTYFSFFKKKKSLYDNTVLVTKLLSFMILSFKVDYTHNYPVKKQYLHESCQFCIQVLNYTVITFLGACKHWHGLSLPPSLTHLHTLCLFLSFPPLSGVYPARWAWGGNRNAAPLCLPLPCSFALSVSLTLSSHALTRSLSHLLSLPLSLSPCAVIQHRAPL